MISAILCLLADTQLHGLDDHKPVVTLMARFYPLVQDKGSRQQYRLVHLLRFV